MIQYQKVHKYIEINRLKTIDQPVGPYMDNYDCNAGAILYNPLIGFTNPPNVNDNLDRWQRHRLLEQPKD